MERKLALWFGIPFLVLAWAFIATDILAPGLLGGDLFMMLILSLAVIGVMGIIVRAIIQMRSGESAVIALWPIAAIFVTIVLSFHHQMESIGRGILNTFMTGEPASEGMRFSVGEDGRFHPRADIAGKWIDFVVDTEIAEIVLTPDDARRIGIDLSSLTFDQQIETPRGLEAVANIQLDNLRIGFLVVERVPAKVSATGKSGNILGMAFLDRLSDWRIENDMLVVRQ